MSKPDKKTNAIAAKPDNTYDNKRRNFLIGAGLGSAAAAAAVASNVTGVQPETKVAAEPIAEGKKGYQETEHVRRYYGTTRL